MKKKLSTLKKDRWKLTSEYIRRKFADTHTGMCSCVTCGMTKHWKEMQAGHFIPKAQGNAIYFAEENIHPQCYRCNINLGGNGAAYYPYMLDMYGQEMIDELNELKETNLKFTAADHIEAIEDLKQKLKEMS